MLKAVYKHFLKHKCVTVKSTIVSVVCAIKSSCCLFELPAAAYLNYQLPTRLSGVLSYYNKMAEQKIPAVLCNFVLPEYLKGVFKAMQTLLYNYFRIHKCFHQLAEAHGKPFNLIVLGTCTT